MANISNKVYSIRQSTYGKDVRESIAAGIEAINTEVEDTTNRQNVIDSQEQSRIDAENIRKSNETNRQNSESTRQTTFEINEADRQDTFKSNESTRQTTFNNSESTRQTTFNTNEQSRIDAENARQTNETYRETVFAAMEHAEPTIEMVEARGTYPTLKDHFVAIETDIDNINTTVGNLEQNTAQLSDMKSYYLDLSAFGVYEDGVTDNTTAFSNAIASAKASGKTIKLKPITYVLSALIIDGVHIDCNGATLKVSSNVTIKHDGIIENGIIDGGGILSQTGKQTIKYITVKNFPTFAISVSTGAYENIIDFIRIENNSNSTDTKAILINASDNHIGHVYGYGAFEGIHIDGGSDNFFNNIHLWLNANNTFTNSTFIHVADGTGNYFDNCCSDTYNNIFKFDAAFLLVKVKDLFIIHNTVLYKNVTINFINANSSFLVGNCIIKGTSWSGNGVTFSNNYNTAISFTAIDYNFQVKLNAIELNNLVSGVGTFSTNSKIKISGDKLFGDITLFFTSLRDLSTGAYTIDLSSIQGIKNFNIDTYGLCVGTGNGVTMVLCALSNGILTIQQISGMVNKIWSVNVKIIGVIDNYIN